MGYKLLTSGFVVSLLFLTFGIVGVLISDSLIKNLVSSSVKLEPNTDIFNQWLDPPVDVYLTFYLFDLKNGEDFEKRGFKPMFEEVGPFVYREYIMKEDVVIHLNNTISYSERKRYAFVPELSAHDENFIITTLNLAPIVAINKLKYFPDWVRTVVDGILVTFGETLLITKSVREIMFGYHDPILAAVKAVTDKFDKNLIPSDLIGFFIGKNDTVDGNYTIESGSDDYNKIGLVKSFNGQKILSVWPTVYANMINGTDGTILPPFIGKDKIIYIFNNDLCRSLYAVYNDTIRIVDDIELYGFSPNEYFFADHSVNPDNGGFCSPAGNCLGAGLLNLTLCVQGLPIIMSCPHFLFGYENLTRDVDGLNPILEKHQTKFYVEPLSGVLMKANKRIQFNTFLFKDPKISVTKNLPEILYPLFWADENFIVDKKTADKFKSQVQTPLLLLNIFKYLILVIGAVGLLTNIVYGIHLYQKNKKVTDPERAPILSNTKASLNNSTE